MKNTTTILFDEFQKLPKGILIDNPNELIRLSDGVFFTRRTLKHLAEKGIEGKRLFGLVPNILKRPDLILKGKKTRIVVVRFFPDEEGEPHVVVVEPKDQTFLIVVTSFVTDKKYLKNFEILWRTGTSLS